MFGLIKKQNKTAILFFLAQLFVILGIFAFYRLGFATELIPAYKEFAVLICFLLVLIIGTLFFLIQNNKFRKMTKLNLMSIANTVGANIYELNQFGETAMITYDSDYNIIWTSDLLVNRSINLIGISIFDLQVEFKKMVSEPESNDITELTLSNRIYEAKLVTELNTIFVKDVTDYKNMINKVRLDRVVMGQLVFDNYADLMLVYEESLFHEIIAIGRQLLKKWCSEMNIVVREYKSDSLFLLMTEEIYEKIVENQFSIINTVRDATANYENPLTISIGISRGVTSLLKLHDLSTTAVNVALSRGGVQAVVNTYGANLEFFGGKVDSKKRRSSNVKARTNSQSLAGIISSYKKVMVMAHTETDFDAIGACLGIQEFARNLNVPCYIVYEESKCEYKVRLAMSETFSAKKMEEISLTSAKAMQMIADDTLLILVDVHRPSMTVSPELVSLARTVAVIDHHRRSEEFVENPVFVYVDPSASSTCELITELISFYNDGFVVNSDYATFMLTGMMLDTNNFRTHTSERTFSLASTIRNWGADVDRATDNLKDFYEETQLQTQIISTSVSPYTGFVIAHSVDTYLVTRAVLAKAAESILQIRDVEAVFVIGRTESDMVSISARSNRKWNVQIIMEKLGGGGHFNIAATQIFGEPVEEVQERLLEILEKNREDARVLSLERK